MGKHGISIKLPSKFGPLWTLPNKVIRTHEHSVFVKIFFFREVWCKIKKKNEKVIPVLKQLPKVWIQVKFYAFITLAVDGVLYRDNCRVLLFSVFFIILLVAIGCWVDVI